MDGDRVEEIGAYRGGHFARNVQDTALFGTLLLSCRVAAAICHRTFPGGRTGIPSRCTYPEDLAYAGSAKNTDALARFAMEKIRGERGPSMPETGKLARGTPRKTERGGGHLSQQSRGVTLWPDGPRDGDTGG